MTDERTLVANLVLNMDEVDAESLTSKLNDALSSDLNINVPEKQTATQKSETEEAQKESNNLLRTLVTGSDSESSGGIKGLFSKGLSSMKEAFGGGLNAVKGAIGAVGGAVTVGFGVVRMVFDAIEKIIAFGKRVSPLFREVLDMFTGVIKLIFGPLFTAIGIELIPILKDLYERVMQLVRTMWQAYEQDGLKGMIRELLSGLGDVFLPLIADMWEFGATILSEVIGGVLDTIFGKNSWDTVKNAILTIARFVNAYANTMNAVSGGFDFLTTFLRIVKPGFGFADGGVVEPTPGGTLVTVAEAGEREFIVPQSKVSSFIQSQSGTAGGNTYYITVYGYTDTDLTEKIVSAIDQTTDRARLMGGI